MYNSRRIYWGILDLKQITMPRTSQELEYQFLDACAKGDTKIVESCLNIGVDVNCCDDRKDVVYKAFNPTPALIIAIILEKTEIVNQLLRSEKLNVNVHDGAFKKPAIIFALHQNNQEIVNGLVSHAGFVIEKKDFYLLSNNLKSASTTPPDALVDKLTAIEEQLKDDEYDMLKDVPEDGAPGIIYGNDAPTLTGHATLTTEDGEE